LMQTAKSDAGPAPIPVGKDLPLARATPSQVPASPVGHSLGSPFGPSSRAPLSAGYSSLISSAPVTLASFPPAAATTASGPQLAASANSPSLVALLPGTPSSVALKAGPAVRTGLSVPAPAVTTDGEEKNNGSSQGQDLSSSTESLDDVGDGSPGSKRKRKRTSPEQLRLLESTFSKGQHPSLGVRNQLASQLGMTPRSVQIWFAPYLLSQQGLGHVMC